MDHLERIEQPSTRTLAYRSVGVALLIGLGIILSILMLVGVGHLAARVVMFVLQNVHEFARDPISFWVSHGLAWCAFMVCLWAQVMRANMQPRTVPTVRRLQTVSAIALWVWVVVGLCVGLVSDYSLIVTNQFGWRHGLTSIIVLAACPMVLGAAYSFADYEARCNPVYDDEGLSW